MTLPPTATERFAARLESLTDDQLVEATRDQYGRFLFHLHTDEKLERWYYDRYLLCNAEAKRRGLRSLAIRGVLLAQLEREAKQRADREIREWMPKGTKYD